VTAPAPGRVFGPSPPAVLRHPLLLLAGVLGVVSLGLPWGVTQTGAGSGITQDTTVARTVIGAEHPVRVIGLAAALLLVTAVRRGRPGRARAAVALGTLALPLGLSAGLTSGRAVYLLALLLAAMGSGVLPHPGSPRRSGASAGGPDAGGPDVGGPDVGGPEADGPG
jgi:hypothetical protein